MNKKFLLIILLLIILLISNIIIFLHHKKLNLEISTALPMRLNIPNKVHLVTYAGGKQIVHYKNQNALMASAINQGFDVLHTYNYNHLDANFIEINKKILKKSRGAGYWLWKPYIILKTLESTAEGDIIVYLDSGALIYKKHAFKYINKLIKQILKNPKDIFLKNNYHSNRAFVKRDLLLYFNMDNDRIRDATQLDASIIILKNSIKSKKFIKEWLEICTHEDLLTDLPSVSQEHSDFTDHRHDQAILTLLSYKYNDICEFMPNNAYSKWILAHKRRNKDKDSALFIRE